MVTLPRIGTQFDRVRTDLNSGFGAIEEALNSIENGTYIDRGTLDPSVSLNDMTSRAWNGVWTIGSANLNPNLPANPGVVGKLKVENSLNDRYMRIDFRAGAGKYERTGFGNTFYEWDRIDSMFTYQGQPPSNITALSQLNTRRHMGVWRIQESRGYTDLPSFIKPGWRAGSLVNFPDGLSTNIQFLTVNYQDADKMLAWRTQTGPGGSYTDWVPMGSAGNNDEDYGELIARIALIEAALPQPETTFENTRIFTTYEEGEAYTDWIARRYPDKVKVLDLGKSRQGRAIRAFEFGDPTKPTYYVLAAQHGSEPMGREAAYIWVRELCQSTDASLADFLKNACIVVAPVINVDMINVQRLSSSNTDLNGNWTTQTTSEIQAAASVFTTHDVVLTLDAHEGGKWMTMEAETPNAPEVAQSLKDVSNALYGAVAADFAAGNEPFERYPGATTLTQARNVIAHRYKSATILFEGTSSLDANMYQPDVKYRSDVYLLAYKSVFKYFKNNLQSFVTAKRNAL